MRILLALLVALTLSAPLGAQERPKSLTYKVAKITFWSGHGADLMSTGRCLGAKTCREANPVLRPLQDHPWALGAAKMAGAAVQGHLLDKLYQKKPKLATAMTFAFAGFSFYIAKRNSEVR